MKREREEWGSPPTRPDREHFDNFEWTPELLHAYADRTREVIDRFWSTDVTNLERIDGGECDECQTSSFVRFQYGHFLLCRTCARRRRRIANTPREARKAA
jgi:hypothetical protein